MLSASRDLCPHCLGRTRAYIKALYGKEPNVMSDERKDLPPAAQRALAEAEERRKNAEAEAKARPKELGGRDGPDPARYGDWEKKGIAIDF
ncbi:hypothetical protein CLV75_3753 [Ruegeria conchae]|uniref:DUF1674 domain-containing protein n=2 Tax=Ruegeria conchae TaxID=981384 RepID=A0A497YUT3_9RHOB|nr:hypothetical protein CLV75_3753 [Ruegeria conchae]